MRIRTVIQKFLWFQDASRLKDRLMVENPDQEFQVRRRASGGFVVVRRDAVT